MRISFRPQVVVALVGMAIILAVLAATAGANISPSQPGSREGDTYVEAMVGAPHLVNPLLAFSDTDVDLAHLVFSGLTRVDDKGNIVLDLAGGWQTSTDGLVYTFTLRPDLKWQDGEPLTSSDVLFTVGAVVAEGFPGDPALVAAWHDIKVATPNAQTVSFTLPSADAAFLQKTTLGILPRHVWGSVKASDLATSEANSVPVGSGPWKYTRVAPAGSSTAGPTAVPPSEGVVLEPNPYWIGPSQSTGIGRIWMRLYPSFGAALTGFRLGEVHGLGHIPTDRLSDVASIPGAELHKQGLARYSMLIMNVHSPLLDQPVVRQAIELAIDKQALVQKVVDGYGEPLNSPVLPHSWAYDRSLPARSYNPSEADRLLDNAGWVMGPGAVRERNGVTMTMVLVANKDVPTTLAAAQQVEGYLRNVGIDARLAAVSRGELLRDYLGPRAFHLALVGWEAQGADPDLYTYWHSSQATAQGGLNFSGWVSPRADQALKAAISTTDQAERVKQYAAFQAAFANEAPAAVLFSPLYVYATRSPAHGISLPTTDLLSPAQRFDTIGNWSLRP